MSAPPTSPSSSSNSRRVCPSPRWCSPMHQSLLHIFGTLRWGGGEAHSYLRFGRQLNHRFPEVELRVAAAHRALFPLRGTGPSLLLLRIPLNLTSVLRRLTHWRRRFFLPPLSSGPAVLRHTDDVHYAEGVTSGLGMFTSITKTSRGPGFCHLKSVSPIKITIRLNNSNNKNNNSDKIRKKSANSSKNMT